MKKMISLLGIGLLLVSMAGCSSSTAKPSEEATASMDPNTSGMGMSPDADGYSNIKIGVLLSGPPTDGGYCQQGADGIRAIQEKYGLSDGQISIVDSVSTAETARQEAENMAADGYKAVFGQGGEYAAYFEEVAKDYPDTWFVTNGGNVVGKNQFPICISSEEGSYVCGVIAGLMTESNINGIIAGGDFPSFVKPGVGFAMGAKAANPDITVSQIVLSATNANEAYETAMSQIKNGADFIFCNANEGTAGAIKAIDENSKVYGFGIFGDYIPNSPDHVIGNCLADAPGAYVAAFDAIMKGEATGEIMFLGMAEGVVTFQWNLDLKAKLPAGVVAAAEKAMEEIKMGEISVPNEYEISALGAEAFFK